MKRIFLILPILCISISSFCQPVKDWYSFWLGDWNLTWQDGNGGEGHGTNHVVRLLDDSVIQENFVATEGALAGFKGMSLSVYNPQSKQWKQAWVDNQGGYFDFTGRQEGDRYYFETIPQQTPQGEVQKRMVFYDITDSTLTWDWEITQDGGENWQLLWRIHYTRKG